MKYYHMKVLYTQCHIDKLTKELPKPTGERQYRIDKVYDTAIDYIISKTFEDNRTKNYRSNRYHKLHVFR